jgi:hypothetical protein
MKKKSFWSQVLIITSLLLVAVFVMALKRSSSPDSVAPKPSDLPEVQLERALADRKPTLAFYHSVTCDQCKQMMKAMDEAYPEFANQIVLVDVMVYEEYNAEMVEDAGILTIPALMAYDRKGQQRFYVGSLDAQFLREIMQMITEETMP